MIIEKDGRAWSERTPEETAKTLKKDLASLTPAERETLELLLKELETPTPATGGKKLIQLLGDSEYQRTPVDMRTFCLDPYYLGNTCDNIYPKLLDDLSELFSGDYHEAILSGSIGWGKTFFASIGICRILYELSCMVSPHDSFGLGRDTNISIVNLSVSEALAVKVVFENVATKIKASPYFKEHFPFEATKKELRFPNNVWVAARATSDTSALGLNIISALMDETNFMPQPQQRRAAGMRWEHTSRADTLYAAIQRRMKSRFQRQGRLPGILFIVSSKRTSHDFTAQRIRESKHDPTVFVRDYPLWGVKPDAYYAAKKFWVLCGNETVPSKIVTTEEVAELRTKLPEGTVMIEVPEDFRADFERDLEGSMRDLAGVATVAISPYIQRRDKIEEAIDISRIHPFSKLVHDPSKPGQFLWEHLVKEGTARNPGGASFKRLRPLLDPNAVRHVHIDPSLSGDATGFCMAHIGGWKDVVRRAESGHEYMEHAPIYVVDFVLRIVPPVGDEIVLGDVRQLVYDLTAHGFLITNVTLDSFQSADALQQLGKKGYNAERLSVDAHIEPYDNLKTALYEGRVRYYNYPPLIDELRTLEHIREKNKVDHPSHGSKDVADAVAGCLYTLSLKQVAQPLPFLRGSGGLAGEVWMDEQRQSAMAGNEGAANNRAVLPAFLVGSGGDEGDGWFPR